VIYNYTEIRYHALINNSNWCVIYKKEVFLEIRKRQHIAGFVKKVQDDRKIALCLQKPGPEKLDDVLVRIIAKPNTKGGFISARIQTLRKPSTAVQDKYEDMQKSPGRSP
jgi:predicted RNA-binding protein (virulence factor B family)